MMKKTLSIITILLFFLAFSANAQEMGPSTPPGGGPIGDDTPIGGGAPIGGGSLILIGLAAAYGGKKVFDLRKNEEEEN